MNRLFDYYRRKLSLKLRQAFARLGQKPGQATTELAVMGLIMLIVLGVLLRYAQMMNAQQEIKMYAHRRALELAKRRRDSGRYGAVSLTAMREVYPVNIFSAEREPTYVSGSSSISMHEETGYFVDSGDADRTDPNFVGASYYQIGADMINNDEVIVMPFILVNKEIDSDSAPSTPWDGDIDWMQDVLAFGQSDPDPTDYDTLEPAPIGDMDQFMRTVSATQYSSTETPTDTSYSESNTLDVVQTSTYKFLNATTIKAWDSDVNSVMSTPAEDMVIEVRKTVEQDRAWNTPK